MKKPSELSEYTVIHAKERGVYIRYDNDWFQVYVLDYQWVFGLEEADEELVPYKILSLPVGETA